MLVMRGSGLVIGADGMARQRNTVEEVINKLREAEVGLAPGIAVPEDSRKLSVNEQTHFRWRKQPMSSTNSISSRGLRPRRCHTSL